MQEQQEDHTTHYQKNSLSLLGTIALGTGVMIGAGIFSLTGQMAELVGSAFPFAFLAAAIVVSFSAYSYIKVSNKYPSAGGIGMYLHKMYGHSLSTAFHALLMYVSMVIAQSFLARTFGSYTMQLFDVEQTAFWVPTLGAFLIAGIFAVNLTSNRYIQGTAYFLGLVKIAGILVFGVLGIYLMVSSGQTLESEISLVAAENDWTAFIAATALGVLAFKGFTTITNSGSEVINPRLNISRAIIISIASCIVIYALVGWSVAGNLSISEIIEARDYSLAAAARPAAGNVGVWFTVIIAIVATAGGLMASVFAVSRMLAMLTEMRLVPHSHFGMPGSIQKHTLVYTVLLGLVLTVFFDLSRIASLGIIFYLVMDTAIHWGVLKHLRNDIQANPVIPSLAICLNMLLLAGFGASKWQSDPLVIWVALAVMAVIWLVEYFFLKKVEQTEATHSHH
ncbi:MAG TPA: APC family permease [Methylophaga aminisulfidivorans]|uniref:Amino acid permease superfamily n=3 Tax=Methylophaga TaxID=40222 RepID=C0N3B5_9GAMM|nr:APC family permease [Methylophaga thiooxydans]EEF80754.1 Amino acid permease superfamily [Methylophaga thiooxydans DMS010]KGM07695.1 Amino acid permease [Methylophaga thiooxydans]HEC73493.1 APC family permease [Methylophaga aminisulfidivorans]